MDATGAEFDNVNFLRADLREANLSTLDVSLERLEGATLCKTIIKSGTQNKNCR